MAVQAGKLAFLVVYTAVLAELFIRVVHPQPRFPRYISGTPWGVRGNIPNASYRHHSADVSVNFKINGQGMRADRDFPEQKPNGLCRIAILGDSFFMGYELDLPDTLGSQLETELNASGKRVEVLNFAVSGFGTSESLRTYEAYVRRFNPDFVLLEWDRSDYDDNVRADLYRLNDGKLVATGQNFLPAVALQDALMRHSVYRWLVDYSDLYSMLREHLSLHARNLSSRLYAIVAEIRARISTSSASAADRTPPQTLYPQPWAGGISTGMVALSAALLDETRRRVEANGSGFMIVEIPYQFPRQQSVSSMSLFTKEQRERWPISSAVNAFNAAASKGPIYYENGDGHIVPSAVKVMAAPILEALNKDPHLRNCGAD